MRTLKLIFYHCDPYSSFILTDFCLRMQNLKILYQREVSFKQAVYREGFLAGRYKGEMSYAQNYKGGFNSPRLNISLQMKCLKWDKAKPVFHVAILKYRNGLGRLSSNLFSYLPVARNTNYFVFDSGQKNKKEFVIRCDAWTLIRILFWYQRQTSKRKNSWWLS